MNYQFLIEGIKNQDVLSSLYPNRAQIQLNIDENVANKLFDGIFNVTDSESIANKINEFYFTEESRLPFYIYSSNDINNDYFKHFGLTIQNANESKMKFIDMNSNKSIGNAFSLEKCLNSYFKDMLVYYPMQATFRKTNSNTKITLEDSNIHAVSTFFKDVCGSIQLSQMFRKGDQPNHIVFYIESISMLNKVLDEKQMELVYEIWKSASKKIINNFAQQFTTDEVYGEAVFIDQGDLNTYFSTQNDGKMSHQIMAEMNKLQKSRRNLEELRVLATTVNQAKNLNQSPITPQNTMYIIKVWFIIVFSVILGFILYALLTVEMAKDTLIYAKFISEVKK